MGFVSNHSRRVLSLLLTEMATTKPRIILPSHEGHFTSSPHEEIAPGHEICFYPVDNACPASVPPFALQNASMKSIQPSCGKAYDRYSSSEPSSIISSRE